MYCNRLSSKICNSFTNVDVIYYCLHFNFAWIHKTIIKCKCIVICYSWQNSERVLNATNQLPRWPSGLGVRLVSQGPLARFPAEKYIFILSFWLVSVPYSSADYCKWNQACQITCSYCCFRPQILLFIQGLVYLLPQNSFINK